MRGYCLMGATSEQRLKVAIRSFLDVVLDEMVMSRGTAAKNPLQIAAIASDTKPQIVKSDWTTGKAPALYEIVAQTLSLTTKTL